MEAEVDKTDGGAEDKELKKVIIGWMAGFR